LILGVGTAFVLREPLLLGLPFAIILFERRALHAMEFKAAESFERDYPALLLSLASGVRTGLDPFVALCTSKELFPASSQMHRELSAVAEAAAQGKSEEESIRAFAASVPHPDLELFRAAFILARREGASLAEALQRLARVTRQRQSFRRKIRSAVAMQKLSAIGIALCTVVIGVMQACTNPAAFQLALAHPIGSKALIGGVCLVVIGLLWMLSLARSRL
jgi:tight adherence protein B